MHRARPLVLVASVALSACAAPEPSMPLVGTFAVHGELQSNGCGYNVVPIPSTFDLEAALHGYSGHDASWQFTGQKKVNGYATNTGSYHFQESADTQVIASDPGYGIAGCTLESRTEIVVSVTPAPSASDTPDGGQAPNYALTGTYVVDVYPTSGSDCSSLLGSNGGSYTALPCHASTNLTGDVE